MSFSPRNKYNRKLRHRLDKQPLTEDLERHYTCGNKFKGPQF